MEPEVSQRDSRVANIDGLTNGIFEDAELGLKAVETLGLAISNHSVINQSRSL